MGVNFLSVKRNTIWGLDDLKDLVNSLLRTEGLKYTGEVNVIHIFNVLHDIICVDKIKKSVRKPLKGLRFASHYGCHAI